MPVFSFHMHFSNLFHLRACVSPVRIACTSTCVLLYQEIDTCCTILVRMMVLTIQNKLEEAIIFNGESVSHECVISFTGLKKREKEPRAGSFLVPSCSFLFLDNTRQTKLL